MHSLFTSRTDQPFWADVTRDECGQPMDKLVLFREYEPELDETLHVADDAVFDAVFVDRIRRIWLRAAGQQEFDFSLVELALFSEFEGGQA
jgi:hypothetical protein